MTKQIILLVVDDEVKITEIVKLYLENNGYRVFCTHGGKQGLNMFYTLKPDMLILDLMLPDISGEEICCEVRKTSKVPIIMLTAKSQEDDMLTGLDLGADDYVTKAIIEAHQGQIMVVSQQGKGTEFTVIIPRL